MVVIEMNPRVSRSSALASKATGFPIAKIAAKLAVGYTLDELDNDITGVTPASFEPTIDYVVTKIPRFAFEKFPGAKPELTTAMKSVGEAMAIGRSFHESLQKALCSLETGLTGFDEIEIAGLDEAPDPESRREALIAALSRATPDRLRVAAQALREGLTEAEIGAPPSTTRGSWPDRRDRPRGGAAARARPAFGRRRLRRLKQMGFSDARLALLAGMTERMASPPSAAPPASARSSSASTPAPPSSRRRRPTCTRPTRPRPRATPNARRGPRRARRS
jgi:carbamoyl-phosphate synthase large subunit